MSESPLPQNKPIYESDLTALVTAAAREDRFLEFKGEYLPQTDGGKRKFLQSITAFANSRGGDLILGMAEADGVATGLLPLNLDPDQSRIQILDLIRVHVRPVLGGVRVEPVALSAGGYALVVRVPKSWVGPHILTYGDDRRFYIRDDGGKRPMDYEEVRDGFLGGETNASRLRNFRMERCAAILNDDVPGSLSQKQRIVLHLLPFEMFARPHRFEVRELFSKCDKLYPINWTGMSRAYDLDGYFSYGMTQDGKIYGYTYAFRSGAIEAVDALMLSNLEEPQHKIINSPELEPKLVEAVQSYLGVLNSLEVSPPYACFLSLLNVRDHYIPSHGAFVRRNTRINRDHLYLAECVLNGESEAVPLTLRPAFDSIWNACGLRQSANYDENGGWRHPR